MAPRRQRPRVDVSLAPDAVIDECRYLSLDRSIQVKRAAGRVKDLEAVAELEAIREARNR